VVTSGGQWTDGDGAAHAKVHLHWRLAVPARGDELKRLKLARDLASRIVGADPSNKPVCHPIRWPGSWHRKGEPILCKIEHVEPDREIDLTTALTTLRAIIPEEAPRANGPDPDPGAGGADWATLVSSIVAGTSYHGPLVSLAARCIGSGLHDGSTVTLLRALMAATTAPHDNRWRARRDAIPRIVRTAREKFTPAKPVVPLTRIDISTWDNAPIPEIEWIVVDRMPRRQVVLFSGQGGAGKSIITLQLCAACVLGRDWLLTMPERGPAMFIDAEDEKTIIHRRLAAIKDFYDVNFADLMKDLHLFSLVGQDALFATVGKNGTIEPTPLYKQLCEAAGDIRPVIIGLASSANVYAGSEIDRSQVQQFIGLLTRLAILANGTLVLLSHPSLTGINTDTGLSESTSWHNSVRARAYLKGVKPNDGEEPDDDLRELTFRKNNYAGLAATVPLRFQNGLFVPIPGANAIDQAAHEANAEDVFLTLLARFSAANRHVSDKLSRNYAPTLFAREREARAAGLDPKTLAGAMDRLFAKGIIWNEPIGRPSRPAFRLARKSV
jgi:RecA-family ATPase